MSATVFITATIVLAIILIGVFMIILKKKDGRFMSETQKGYVLWGINIVVVALIGLLTINANRICAAMDAQDKDIQTLKQESVRWNIMAEDVREIKSDMKTLLRKTP